MDEIFDRIKQTKIKRRYLVSALVFTEILGIITLIWYLRTPLSQKFLQTSPQAFSVVSLNPEKQYLASNGDFLVGKAIPNTQVKVLITPGSLKYSAHSDSNGDWNYQIPPTLNKGVYRFSFGNFDKNNKLVTFQSYKFRLQSNISPIRLLDKIWHKISSYLTINKASAQVNSAINFNYSAYGIPQPNSFIEITEDETYRLENYFLPYAYSAAKITGADWRLMAMWIFTEDYITNYMDNCFDGNKEWGEDADANQNTPCTGWTLNGAPNWQVGWGIMPYQWVDRLPEAMAIMRPGESIQQIGQRVIDQSYEEDRYPKRGIVAFKRPSDPITNPKVFPGDVTLAQIIEGSKPVGSGKQTKPCPRSQSDLTNFRADQDPKDCDMRQLLGVLMKDPAISAYFLGLMWRDIENKGSLPGYFAGWGPERNPKGLIQNPYINSQKVSNTIAAIENAVSGLDLGTIALGPRITVPVATSSENKGSLEVEAVVSDSGEALDDQQIAGRNLKVNKVVLPAGTNPVDFGYGANPENYVYQPNTQNNVKGISTMTELTFDNSVSASPDYYQLCVLLETVEFEKVIDYNCIPMSQIIDPQTPLDTSTTSPNTIEEIPNSSALETQNSQPSTGPIFNNGAIDTPLNEPTAEPKTEQSETTEETTVNTEEP